MPAKLYEWDKWFTRNRFVLKRGKDYLCASSSFIGQIRNAAAVRKLLVSIEPVDDAFIVTVKERNGSYATSR